MDGWSAIIFGSIFELSTQKNLPLDTLRHKPYLLILLLAAPGWAAAVTQLPYGWAAAIFGSILELSTRKKNLPLDTS